MTDLTLDRIKEAIADAQGRRPYAGHIRCSPATYVDIRAIGEHLDETLPFEQRFQPRTPAPDAVPVVVDPDIPDGELEVRVLGETPQHKHTWIELDPTVGLTEEEDRAYRMDMRERCDCGEYRRWPVKR